MTLREWSDTAARRTWAQPGIRSGKATTGCVTRPTSKQACIKRLVWRCLQVEDLARLSFKRKPVYVGVDDQRQEATREGLEQGYCVVDSEQRFLLMFTFLKRNANKKVAAAASCLLASDVALSAAPHSISVIRC